VAEQAEDFALLDLKADIIQRQPIRWASAW
jgi:hypothetical protein